MRRDVHKSMAVVVVKRLCLRGFRGSSDRTGRRYSVVREFWSLDEARGRLLVVVVTAKVRAT
jgi:hypothetical protein